MRGRGDARRLWQALAVAIVAVAALATSGCPSVLDGTYTVTYDANDATSGSAPPSQTKTHAVALTLATNSGNLARTGYTYTGWNTQPNGSGTDYAEGASYTANASVTLYAKWVDSERQSDDVGTLRYVPGGTYQRDGTATNTTTVSGFYMSVHEITRARFLAIMGTDPSNESLSSGMSDPVQNINWYHALAFCNKVSIAEGRTPVYGVSGVDWVTLTYVDIPTDPDSTWSAATMNMAANGYRLPTEAEWMWAAMGADQDAQPGAMQGGINRTGYAKPFAGSNGSNAIGDYAGFGYYGTEEGGTTAERSDPVGSREPNELGLYDMSGNVLEWTWDRSEIYPSGELSDPVGPISGESRVARGGGWGSDGHECAVAYRDYASPYARGGGLGFRVVSR